MKGNILGCGFRPLASPLRVQGISLWHSLPLRPRFKDFSQSHTLILERAQTPCQGAGLSRTLKGKCGITRTTAPSRPQRPPLHMSRYLTVDRRTPCTLRLSTSVERRWHSVGMSTPHKVAAILPTPSDTT